MMARSWPLRQRSLHADRCTSERVSEQFTPQSALGGKQNEDRNEGDHQELWRQSGFKRGEFYH
ncbi:hypothetical protein GEK51_13045 [Lacticaseibacillus rhamnosus]|nr:hypothetical protein GEK51_13045 [Lacticaseibacillus rhamnosus]